MDIVIKYVNPSLNIGLADIKNAWLLTPEPVRLSVAVHRGLLIYRLPVSGKRISYARLKKGLIKRRLVLKQNLPSWVFPGNKIPGSSPGILQVLN